MVVYETSGSVTVRGRPAEGAEVVLYGATPDLRGPGTVAPSGTADADGEFKLRSYETGDGAPAGSFNVTIFWPEEPPPDADEEMFQPRDRLQGKYLDPEKSGLTAVVPEGGGQLPPFEL
ncbi:MAG: hypothetical protein AAF961_06050 [Planctomycetota bacterium]